MILSIESSLSTFKTVTFHEGLNVLLADSSPLATAKQTRNSAGKTSLTEIIHFLFGSDCDKESLFRTDALIAHSFQITFTIDGEKFVVARSDSDPSKIWLIEGGKDRADLSKKIDKETGGTVASNVNWRNFAGIPKNARPR